VRACVQRDRPGPYQLQAAINAVHSIAPGFDSTDWRAIMTLYDQLYALTPTPVVALNRAVALAEVRGPAAGLAAVDEPRTSDAASTATTCSTRHAPTCCAASAGTRKPRRPTTPPARSPPTRSSRLSSTRNELRSPDPPDGSQCAGPAGDHGGGRGR
jgi:hypothetical protein